MAKVLNSKERDKQANKSEYSESYNVKFWILDGNFWKQKTEMYYARTKGAHEAVYKKWQQDYKGQNAKYVSTVYQ